MLARESRLKEQLAKLGDRYQTILIDCPPSLHLLTINALTAAHGVLIPVQCEYFALEGLTSLLDTIKAVRTRLNPHLEIEGLLRTMYDVRNNLGNDVSAQLMQHFGDKSAALDHPAQHPPRRSAEPRQADQSVRPRIARRDRLSRPCRRDAAARTHRRSAARRVAGGQSAGKLAAMQLDAERTRTHAEGAVLVAVRAGLRGSAPENRSSIAE